MRELALLFFPIAPLLFPKACYTEFFPVYQWEQTISLLVVNSFFGNQLEDSLKKNPFKSFSSFQVFSPRVGLNGRTTLKYEGLM